VTVTDSQSNAYALLAAPGGDQLRTSVFAAAITRALAAGDVITVTHPDGSATSALAVELRGVVAPPVSISSAGATNTAIDVPFSPPAAGLVHCAIGTRNASYAIAGPWREAAAIGTACGGAPGGSNNLAYWLPAPTPVGRCEGAITGGADNWQAVVATFGQ
jgi:hypothetical protein